MSKTVAEMIAEASAQIENVSPKDAADEAEPHRPGRAAGRARAQRSGSGTSPSCVQVPQGAAWRSRRTRRVPRHQARETGPRPVA